MIDETWRIQQMTRLEFNDDQMDTLLRIAARAWVVAARTTYDDLAAHLLARKPTSRPYELERMAAILGEDKPDVATLEMATHECDRLAQWHVHHADGSGQFFCNQHNANVKAVRYDGVEPCQGQSIVIREPAPTAESGGGNGEQREAGGTETAQGPEAQTTTSA